LRWLRITIYDFMKSFAFLLFFFVLSSDYKGKVEIDAFSAVAPSEVCLTTEEEKLYDLIMRYRKSKNLDSIPISAKLTSVAQIHSRDLMENYSFSVDNKCNPHSWSKKGKWSSCCYTTDHKQALCMWNKPKELTEYPSYGYEIAYYSSAGATAEEGLDGWKKSQGHNPLLINSGMWEKVKWKAIGIAVYGNYGIVWFGESPDDSQITHCD
jgi:uncharacterized protein YkwD